MKIEFRSAVLGAALTVILVLAALVSLFFAVGPDEQAPSHTVVLPSGKRIEVTMCNFAWGVEHSERDTRQDSFALEYVSTVSQSDLAALDRETLEVFALIRPISELWGLARASVSAFPSITRKGKYFTYVFSRDAGGQWTYQRTEAKVFAND